MKYSMSSIDKALYTPCWLLFDAEKKGSENQCVGLAAALNLNFKKFPVKISKPWIWLPRFLWPLSCGLSALPETLPKIIICSGRKSASIALKIKEKNPGIKVICLLNPRFKNDAFDLIIAPKHDRLKGPNVIETIGVLHHVTPQALESAEGKFSSLQDPSKPNLVVLIGGSNKYMDITQENAQEWAQAIHKICLERNYNLRLTFSRRTPEAVQTTMRQNLEDLPGAYIWDGLGDNPYFAFLSMAHTILVTGDSVSMLSEASSLGKPLYILAPKVRQKSKFNVFWEDLIEYNHGRIFKGDLDQTWIQTPLDNISGIRAKMNDLLNL